jgi:hypothetical protein
MRRLLSAVVAPLALMLAGCGANEPSSGGAKTTDAERHGAEIQKVWEGPLCVAAHEDRCPEPW